MIPVAVESRYRRDLAALKSLEAAVQPTLWNFCRSQGYALTLRLKSLDSVAQKIESGRFRRWSEIDDLLAATVIVPTLRHEEDVLAYLADTFDIRRRRLRSDGFKAPDAFRFEATRVTVNLRPAPGTEPTPIESLPFEIQIRTAFEHAWSVTTHALAYKGDTLDWKKLRLAAQLKAAVEQLDLLIIGFENVAEQVMRHGWFEVATGEQIFSLLERLFAERVIPPELQPINLGLSAKSIAAAILDSRSAPRPPRERETFWRQSCETVEARLRANRSEGSPRALSLFQYVFGELAKAGVITPPLTKFTPPVTAELVSLYPEVRAFGTGFDFEDE